MTEVVRRTLSQAGWSNVIVTNDALQAAPLALKHWPHVILLDQQMPAKDGIAVLKELSPLRDAMGMSILMLTADKDRKILIEAFDCGAQDFIAKPFRVPELLARVGVASEIQRLRRLLLEQNTSLEETVRLRTARLETAVSVLKAAEAKLKDALASAEAERYRLMAQTVHELRTPLNGIIGYAQMVTGEVKGAITPGIYREYVARIETAGEHMTVLIDQLLDLARSTAEGEPLRFEKVNLPDLVRQSLALLMPDAMRDGVTLKLNVKPGIDEIETDPVKLRQIVLNLTSNAVKFTPRGGKVVVELGPDAQGGAYILIVRDSGIGIKPEDLDRVMKPFGQVAGAQDGRKKGTGLGMPLTKRFVEQLGGTLELESEFGQGTTITVRLPARGNA
jgi:signal transduction histidine kinase